MRAYVTRTLPHSSAIVVANRAPHEPRPEGGFTRGAGGVITALLTLAEVTAADWVACARTDAERQLVDNANGTLGLMESLLAFDDVQALTVGDERQEDHNLFPAGRAKHLPHVLSGRLAIQIGQQGPRVEHDDPTSWSCHAAVLPSASASNASGAIARAC